MLGESRFVLRLSCRERSDRIARCDPGEGLRSLVEPEPLTRRYAPTSPRRERWTEPAACFSQS